jgi:hypothetical protein
MDFGMRCRGCGHFVMLPRPKFEKMVRAIVEKADAHENKKDDKGLSSLL